MNFKKNKKEEVSFNPKQKKQSGVTMFFAILVSGVMLAIGMTIFSISYKELILSSTIRDSQAAFYAADAGSECALYWDLKFDSFNPVSTTTNTISCGEKTFSVGAALVSTIDNIKLSPEPYCAVVTVTKSFSDSGYDTVIESRGYNTCDTTRDRRVERGIIVKY